MKLALLVVLTIAALALLGMSVFSSPDPELGVMKLDLLDLRQENQNLSRQLTEAQSQIEELSGQVSFLESGVSPTGTRSISSPSAAELLAAGTSGANSASANANNANTLGDALNGAPTPAQAAWLDSALRQTLRNQAEDQRKRVLEAQIQFVKGKLDEATEKMKLQGVQKDQFTQTVESYLRNRSEIRGTRSWWEFSNEEWEAMRGQLKTNDQARKDQLAQILTPDQLKELKQLEKKKPSWFNPGTNFNPRGADF